MQDTDNLNESNTTKQSDNPEISWSNLHEKIKNTHKKAAISLAVISKQTRFRLEKIEKILITDIKPEISYSIPQKKILIGLAQFYKIEHSNYDENLFKNNQDTSVNFTEKIQAEQKTNLNLPVGINESGLGKKNKIFIWFTATNFNFLGITILALFISTLILLPAYVVARPAELTWDQTIRNNRLIFDQERQIFSGRTYRAKNMSFGGQTVKIINDRFTLNLPNPAETTTVTLVLTNYFNIKTTYSITLD